MQEKKSKSAKKREHLALQILGEQLIGISETQLRNMSLDDDLREAIETASTITSHSALRRQRQLIGKLMSRIDPEPVRAELDALTQDSQQSRQAFRQAEEWRDKIVNGGHPLLENFFELTGRRNGALKSLVDDLGRARTESQRRTVRRSIFRRVHEELDAAVHG